MIRLKDGDLDAIIQEPYSLADDWKRKNFTDGSFIISYDSGRVVYYAPVLVPGFASTYDIAVSPMSYEDLKNGTARIEYNNGTIILNNTISGNITYIV